MIEGEHSLFSEGGNELNREERIAAGLFVHQLREQRGAVRLAAKSVRHQLPHVFTGEGPKRDLRDLSTGGLYGVELPHQRMGRDRDFVVAIGTDQHQVR